MRPKTLPRLMAPVLVAPVLLAPVLVAPLLVAPVLLAPLVLASPAQAQQNPTADQIIQSLRPSGHLGVGTSRGIRPAATASAPVGATATATPRVTGTKLTSAATPAALQAASPSTSATTEPPSAGTAGPSVNLTVNFASGSADLTPEAVQTLDTLGQALSSPALAGYRFRIEGHTDTVGSPEANQALSQRRATAVVTYIASKFGVDAGRLVAVGMGEKGLLVPTGAHVAEARNRRVQVINLGS